MGFGIRTEYTIELLRNPKAYNYIGRHYYATGFILASNFHEAALQLLLERWQQIDSVTADRIRFLFFIDNETNLPHRFFLSASGYERQHADLLRVARKQGFEFSMKIGTQESTRRRRRMGDWSPDRWLPQDNWFSQDRVRKLAQQLGITSLLPCLVWSRYDNPKVFYAKRIENLRPDGIFALVREFCDLFYDLNTDYLLRIDQSELQIDTLCSQLDLTLKDLDYLSLLIDQRAEINKILPSIQNLSLSELDWASLINTVAGVSERMLRFQPLYSHLEAIQKKVIAINEWANKCKKINEILLSQADIHVRYLADDLFRCFTIESNLEMDNMRFNPPLNTGFSSELLAAFLEATNHDKIEINDDEIKSSLKSRLNKVRNFLLANVQPNESLIILPATKQNIIAFVNIRKILNEIIRFEFSSDPIGVKSLYFRVDNSLKSVFYDTTLALAITFRLWIYSELRETSKQIANEIMQKVGMLNTFKDLNQDLIKWQKEVQETLQQINGLSDKLVWDMLSSYERFNLPNINNIPLPLAGLNSQPKSNEIVEDLSEKIIKQLLPIEQIMSQLDEEQAPSTNGVTQINQYQEAFPSEKTFGEKSVEEITKTLPIKIFYCYAHEDKDLRDRIDKHLGILKRLEQIIGWCDREIQAGTEWEHEIEENLNTAHLILLLVSADFVASDYCYGVEMKKALELHQTGRVRVLPILLRPVDWQGAPFATLQMLPTGAKPIMQWKDQDEALEDVAKGIRNIVNSLRFQKR